MDDIELILDQFRETRKISFPNNIGISGKCFFTKSVLYSNKAIQETKFTNDIDNQTEIKDVQNYLIGPCFGHPRDGLTKAQKDIGDGSDSEELENHLEYKLKYN